MKRCDIELRIWLFRADAEPTVVPPWLIDDTWPAAKGERDAIVAKPLTLDVRDALDRTEYSKDGPIAKPTARYLKSIETSVWSEYWICFHDD